MAQSKGKGHSRPGSGLHGGRPTTHDPKGKGKGDGKGKNDGKGNHHSGGGHGGHKGGGKPHHKGPGRYGAVGGYKGVPIGKAQKLVNSQMASLIRSIQRDKATGVRASNSEVRKADEQYGRATGDLNAIFGDVSGYVDAMGTKIHDQNAQTAGQINQMQAANRQQISDTSNATQAAAQAELQRLGIGAQAMDPRFGADAQFAQNVAAQTDSNNQANMAMQSANADQISALLGGMTRGAQASALGQATNTHNSTVSDINNDRRDMLAKYQDQIMGVRKDKPGAVLELLQQMQDTGFNQWIGVQGVRNDRANLRMDRRQLNAQIAAQRAQTAQESAYASTGAGLWQGAAHSSGGVNYGSPGTSSHLGGYSSPHIGTNGSGSSGVRHSILEPQAHIAAKPPKKHKSGPPPRHSILEPQLHVPRKKWGWNG